MEPVSPVPASQRAWQTACRSELTTLLGFVFASEPLELDQEDFDWIVGYELRSRIGAIVPAWWRADLTRDPLPQDARAQVAEAFALLRSCAHQVATGGYTPMVPMAVQIILDATPGHARARWRLHGRLADGLVWMGLALLSEVDRSLIRLCDYEGCQRVFVGIKNQLRCHEHQAEGRRETQRRAMQAYRKRQRSKKKKTRKTRTTSTRRTR